MRGYVAKTQAMRRMTFEIIEANMTEGNENGARLLLNQIDELLKGKKLTEKERLLWLVHRYSLDAVIASRARHEATETRLKAIEDSKGQWIDRHPVAARNWAVAVFLFLNSDVRQPITEWLGANIATLMKLIGI